eukprot:386471_1
MDNNLSDYCKEPALDKETNHTAKINVTDKDNGQSKNVEHNKMEHISKDACSTHIQQEFTNSCSAIDDCLSVKRMGNALKFYVQIIDNNKGDDVILSDCLLLENYLSEYTNLMNDYGHIIYEHLDKNDNDAQFKQIYDYLINEYDLKCNVNNCSKYHRNCRNMQKQRIIINHDNNDNQESICTGNDYYHLAAYIDILDTIHCNLLHSYDIGYRINKNELVAVINNKNDQHHTDSCRDDLNVNVNEHMVKMNAALASKRKLLQQCSFDRIQNNKFVTTFDNEREQVEIETPFMDDMFTQLSLDPGVDTSTLTGLRAYLDTEEYDTDSIYDEFECIENDDCNLFFNLKSNNHQSKLNCILHIRCLVIGTKPKYSFGIEFYYWPWAKYTQSQRFVKPTYSSLKEEIYEHNNSEIFNNLKTKIETLYSTNNEHIKKKISSKKTWMRRIYGFERDILASAEHLLALKLYTDATLLSAEFSRSFRKLHNDSFADVKKRNEAFAHWSKLLRELVEVFGEDAFGCGNPTYYHGTSYMIFNEFSARFCAPTSTTKHLEVALNFISEDKGIILQLKCGAYVDCMMFNASFFSCFNEDERLFFCGRRKWIFASINVLSNRLWYNYETFVNAFSKHHSVLQGIHTHKISKQSSNIIELLVNYALMNKACSFVRYIKETFIAFCNQITEIKINFFYFPWYNKYYTNFFISNYSEKDEKQKERLHLDFYNILSAKKNLWRYLQKISYCNWDHNVEPKTIHVGLEYLLALHEHICSNKHHQSVLKGMTINIPYTNVNFSSTEYSKLKRLFSPYQLKIRKK